MEKLFELILSLIHKVPWASEWEQTGAHQALADAWDEIAPKLGIDTTAEGYVAPVAQPAKEAPKTAPPAEAPSSPAQVSAIAAAVIEQLRAAGVVPAAPAAAPETTPPPAAEATPPAADTGTNAGGLFPGAATPPAAPAPEAGGVAPQPGA